MLKQHLDKRLVKLLNDKVRLYNNTDFITLDPVSIPHQYSNRLDIEITALWTALLSWGQRKTIINKANELFQLMDNQPHDFIKNQQEKDRLRFQNFKHRTFQPADCYCFLEFFQELYNEHESLENLFIHEEGLRSGLIQFRNRFDKFLGGPNRTQKHISTPLTKSACKRLNMFLRWMVRSDKKGVDFGIWKKIEPAELYIPLDVHVARVARQLGLLKRKQNDWAAVEELSATLRLIDPSDPVKYDYALFGIGVMEN